MIPHQFLAWEDYSLGSHWQRIGSELNITRYYKNIGCYYIDFSYISTDDLSEDSTLALIRSDPNVESVSPNMQFRMEMAVIQNVTSGTRDQVRWSQFPSVIVRRLTCCVRTKLKLPTFSTVHPCPGERDDEQSQLMFLVTQSMKWKASLAFEVETQHTKGDSKSNKNKNLGVYYWHTFLSTKA